MNFEKQDTTIREYLTDIQMPEYHTTGIIHTDAAVFDNSSSYAVLRAVPYEPITDITLNLTPAWWTSTRGHNRHTIEHFMRLGVAGITVGIEGSYRDTVQTTLLKKSRELLSLSLSRSAHHMHKILDTIDCHREDTKVQTTDIVLLGESRGAMVGQGVIALAKSYKRNIVYADLTAPCFPSKFSVTNTPNLMQQITKEPLEFIKMFGSISIRNLVHYPATIDLHPSAIIHNVAIGPVLFSGEAGSLAAEVPQDQHMHITTFHDDFASMPHVWEAIYKHHDNVRIKKIEGAHLTIAHPKTLEYIDKRIFSLLFEIEHVGSKNPQDLDFSKVHLNDV